MKYGLSVNLIKLQHHLIQVNKQMYHSQIPNDIKGMYGQYLLLYMLFKVD